MPTASPCGTNAAYLRHLKYGEKPCAPCVDAYKQHYGDRYKKEKSVRLERLKTDRKARPQLYRNQQLKIKFGITLDEFNTRIKAQHGICPICLRQFSTERKKRMDHMDHDHKTNELRDVLCGGCNVLLGQSDDDPEILTRAAQYLRKWSNK
jgi:hypothetical protein